MSESKRAANKKWNDANLKQRYDRIQMVVPKGRKAELQAHAAEMGESLNAFLIRAAEETRTRDRMK